MAVTIHDVAHLAGVSASTVSKYINGGSLREKNCIKIQKAIEQLGFKPNNIARGLKSNHTYTVGVIMPSLSNTFCATIISSMEKDLQKNGYGVLICDCANDPKAEPSCARFLLEKNVDGIVTMPLSDAPQFLNIFQENDVPIILIDQKPSNVECDSILVDNLNASYHAVEHLINHGHRKIAIICGDHDRFTTQERLTGYLRVLTDYSMPICDEYIQYCNYTTTGGYNAVKSLMVSKEPPTAIFATSYDLTIGAVKALNDLELSIGKDISFIGFDGMVLSELIRPPLTLITQPMEEIGQHAAQLLLRRMQKDFNDYPRSERLKTTFITTNSVCFLTP